MSDANVWNYVIAAYAAGWAGLIGYGIRLFVLNRRAIDAATDLGGEV